MFTCLFRPGVSTMKDQQALELMRNAWAMRRASFDAEPDDKLVILTQARELLEEAASRCRSQRRQIEYAQALHLLANIEVDLDCQDRALSLWTKAVNILRETDDYLQLAHKVRHLGDLHNKCGRVQEAESCYAEAIELYRQHASPGSLDFANAMNRMADLKERLGETTISLELWRETRNLFAAVDLAEGVIEAQQHIDRLTP